MVEKDVKRQSQKLKVNFVVKEVGIIMYENVAVEMNINVTFSSTKPTRLCIIGGFRSLPYNKKDTNYYVNRMATTRIQISHFNL